MDICPKKNLKTKTIHADLFSPWSFRGQRSLRAGTGKPGTEATRLMPQRSPEAQRRVRRAQEALTMLRSILSPPLKVTASIEAHSSA
jgi:hypothetical protein